MVSQSRHPRLVQTFALCLFLALATAQAALAVPNFTTQRRLATVTAINGSQRSQPMGTATSIFFSSIWPGDWMCGLHRSERRSLNQQ